MKILKYTIFSFSLLYILLFLFPLMGLAADYQPLAPIPGYVESSVGNDLNGYLNGMFKLGIALAVGLAVVMIIIGGVQYMSTDAIGKKSDGKARITAAIVGLLVALGSYMLLNTLDPNLLKTELSLSGVEGGSLPLEGYVSSTVQMANGETRTNFGDGSYMISRTESNGRRTEGVYDRQGRTIVPQREVSHEEYNADSELITHYSDGSYSVTSTDDATGQKTVTHFRSPNEPVSEQDSRNEQELRNRLAQEGIGVNKPACTRPGQTDCTNLAGLTPNAINGVIGLRNDSGADVTVTGGTEPGHSAHGPGRPVTDVRKNPALDAYIMSHATNTRETSLGTVYTFGGNTYLNETRGSGTPHWHIRWGGR